MGKKNGDIVLTGEYYHGRCPICGYYTPAIEILLQTGRRSSGDLKDLLKDPNENAFCHNHGGMMRPKKKDKNGRRPHQRVATIRSVSGNSVNYRYFGESYGLRQAGIDIAAAEGFKGNGAELAQKLGVDVARLADSLKVSVELLRKTEYDISKD